MEVTYQNDAESLLALRRLVMRRERNRLLLLSVMYVALVTVPPSLVCLIAGSRVALFTGGSLVLVVLLLISVLVRRSMSNLLQGFMDRGLPVCRLKISPEVFQADDEWGWSRRDWSSIKRVETMSNHVFIFIEEATAHVIPYAAFASPADAETFARLAGEYVDAAGKRPIASFAAPPAPLPADSTTQQVSFVPLASDRAAVVYDVGEQQDQNFQPSGKPPKKMSSARTAFSAVTFLLIWTVLSGWFISDTQKRVVTSVLAGVFLFAIWAFIILLINGLVRRFLASRGGAEDEQTTVTISPAGLLITSPRRESHSEWRSWQDVRHTPGFLLFCTVKQHIAFIIPKRAFATPDAAEHFCTTTKHYWEVAMQAQQATEPEAGGGLATNNPYQAPRGM